MSQHPTLRQKESKLQRMLDNLKVTSVGTLPLLQISEEHVRSLLLLTTIGAGTYLRWIASHAKTIPTKQETNSNQPTTDHRGTMMECRGPSLQTAQTVLSIPTPTTQLVYGLLNEIRNDGRGKVGCSYWTICSNEYFACSPCTCYLGSAPVLPRTNQMEVNIRKSTSDLSPANLTLQ